MRRLALPTLLVALLPLCAAAQTGRDSAQFVHVSPAIGIHYGAPLRLSLAAGGLFDMRGKRNDGIIVMAEPGMGGAELSLGYFRRHRFGKGYSFRAAGIRTGENPWNTSARSTYLGAEAHWMLLAGVGGRVGFFRRVSGSSSDGLRDNLASFGVSVGD
ncbi:MAG: hypothetical protein ABIP93_15625 [Gemmatimonadaceae bacterium]